MDLAGDIIVRNGGFFTRAEALKSGETDRTLQQALRHGEAVRLRHGMYAPASIYHELDERARHLLLARAVLRGQRGLVALTGPSAALLHGFAVWGHDLSSVHLLRLDKGPARREAGVVHHVGGLRTKVDVGQLSGVSVVSPAQAVWAVACLSSLESGVVTADSALGKNPRLVEPLAKIAKRSTSHPRSRRARHVLRLARAEVESPGESLARVAFYRYGIPAPTLQYEVVNEDGVVLGRSDFYWEEYRHLAEFDGKVKYERLLKPGESASDAVVKEKRREDAMRATRRGMSRLVWSEVVPDAARDSMVRFRQDLELSRTLYVR